MPLYEIMIMRRLIAAMLMATMAMAAVQAQDKAVMAQSANG